MILGNIDWRFQNCRRHTCCVLWKDTSIFSKIYNIYFRCWGLIITYFLAAMSRLGHRHIFFAPKFLPVQWIIKVTEILYKILSLNNPKWCMCNFYGNQSTHTDETMYYEVDPGPVGKFILWRGPWTRRKVYIMKWTLDHPTTFFPPDMVPVQWIPSALHKFCFSNKLFRQRPRKHSSRFEYIPYLIFTLSQTPQESFSQAFLSLNTYNVTWSKICSTSVYVYLTWGRVTWGWPKAAPLYANT